MSDDWGYSTEIGEDGWPVDPRHPANEPAEEWRQRVIAERMRRYQRGWFGGYPIALADALRFCQRINLPPPAWLVHGVAQLALGKVKKGPGRRSHKDDRIDSMRWSTVEYLRAWEDRPGPRPTWVEVFEMASDELADTEARGEADTIKKSYQRVLRRSRDGTRVYYTPDLPHWGKKLD